jgi:hypothetical protein
MKKNVIFFRTLWGVNLDFKNLVSIKEQLLKFKKQGFNGVELATGFFDYQYKKDFMKILKELDLKVVTQIHTMGYPIINKNVKDHFEDFQKKVEDSLTWEPVLINSHSGRDDWEETEFLEFFNKISEFEKKLAYKSISHETHRQRVLFNPQNSYKIMKNCDIKFTADLSHWVLVCSRLLEEKTDKHWSDILEILSKRTLMIHARVSSSDQIQVIDPFLETNSEYLRYYDKIWRKIFENTLSDTLCIDPEYGPSPYAILHPKTNDYILDLDEVVFKSLIHLKKLLI